MQVFESISGLVKCRMVSADLNREINRITNMVAISGLEIVDDITAVFWVRQCDCKRLERQGIHINVISRIGIYWVLVSLIKRPVILVGILLLSGMIFFLPTRVLFVTVKGNYNISDTVILDAAENCGIKFGAPRKSVRSEKVKNTLLQFVPQLQWACVNTRGCVAEISVQERTQAMQKMTIDMGNIVSTSDGIITEMTVYRGVPLCRVGEIVKKGQVLVSGYSDLGILIKTQTAEAEIMAETVRSITAVALHPNLSKGEVNEIEVRYGILLGKKLIKFYKDSGILPCGCGRIYKIYNLTLPGGFSLPIGIVKEQEICYELCSYTVENGAFVWMLDSVDAAVCDQMVAGEIIKRTASFQNNSDTYSLYAHYRCKEMIASIQKREMDVADGKRN